MKKTVLISFVATALAASVPAFSQTANFEGLSASAGVSFVGATTKVGAAGEGYAFGETSTVGTVDVGYGIALDKDFVLGVGLGMDLGKTKAGGISMYGQDINFSGKSHYAVYAQPTWVLTPTTAVFAKLGYNSIKGELSENSGFLGNYQNKRHGTSLGLGVKTFVDSNVFVQVEASTTNYGSKTPSAELVGNGDFSVKVKSVSGGVSVGYRF